MSDDGGGPAFCSGRSAWSGELFESNGSKDIIALRGRRIRFAPPEGRLRLDHERRGRLGLASFLRVQPRLDVPRHGTARKYSGFRQQTENESQTGDFVH